MRILATVGLGYCAALLTAGASAAPRYVPTSPPTHSDATAPRHAKAFVVKLDSDLGRRYWPPAAAAKRISGMATVKCTATANGRLDLCHVTSERPDGMGFGEAAIRLSQSLRMRRTTTDGRSVEGGMVDLAFDFRTR